MTHFAARRQPFVIFACPVAQPPSFRHSSSSPGPAVRCIAPSTPPPPSKVVFAAFTMASTACLVMSPSITSILSEILVLLIPSQPPARYGQPSPARGRFPIVPPSRDRYLTNTESPDSTPPGRRILARV